MSLETDNAQRWSECVVNANRTSVFTSVANRLMASKDRYKIVEGRTGVPWWFIAVVHEREASQSWTANIAQGDRWDRVSVHVPRGRGPFESWEDAAVDALTNCAPYAAHNKDWSIGGSLALLEEYNGLGYFHMGKPSPYIWAGTNQYSHGKYVADGQYSDSAVDTQLGCAGLLKEMKVFDTPVELPSMPNLDDINTQLTTATSIWSTTKDFLGSNLGSLGRHGSTSLITGLGSVSVMFTKDWPYILAGSIVLALVIWGGLKLYERNSNASLS